MPRLCSSLLLLLMIASSAPALTMAWTPVGNAGNACELNYDGIGGELCFGGVGYAYAVGTYEVTNVQYAEFLNAKAPSDPFGLYNPNMADPSKTGSYLVGYGGITRTGTSGSYAYTAIPGRENMPVNYVSFYDALRFANWMNNGQGSADTETGAYTITAEGISSNSIARNIAAAIVVTSENEWYKAAYYDPSATTYYDYSAGSDSPTTCAAPTGAPNAANCDAGSPLNDDASDADVDDLTVVGSYTGSASPYGTFDQGGNVWEWIETFLEDQGSQVIRSGAFDNGGNCCRSAASRHATNPSDEIPNGGFRVAMIPEPGTGLLVIAGLLGLSGWRRVRE